MSCGRMQEATRRMRQRRKRSDMCRVVAVGTIPRGPPPVPSPLAAQMRPTGNQPKPLPQPPMLRLRPLSDCGSRRNLHAVLTGVANHSLARPRHTSCSVFLFVDDVSSGAVQLVSDTSTYLVATETCALEAGDQDVDRDLDIVPGRHPGGRNDVDAVVPRAIDERAARGTGYPRRAHCR